MATAIQIFAILGIICLPMISIAALVLTLAAINMSLGIRKIYVKILSFVFDYATKIKKDKEISLDSDLTSTEPPTPQIESSTIESSFDDSLELSPDLSIINESENYSQRSSLQTDIQFKLSTS